jgi:hypothetical protein
VSLIFNIFGSICGPMRKCHMEVCTSTWQTVWYVVSDMAWWCGRWLCKWLAWTNGWLPRGSGKIPNEDSKPFFQK